METNVLATPEQVVAALSPGRLYWKELRRKWESAEDYVQAIIDTPLFRHVYRERHGRNLEDMIMDVRSATGLLTNQLITAEELEMFESRGLIPYVSQGLALAAHSMRPRLASLNQGDFITNVRIACFSFILKLIGEDLCEPRQVLTELIDKLELDPARRMSLLAAAVASATDKSQRITLH